MSGVQHGDAEDRDVGILTIVVHLDRERIIAILKMGVYRFAQE